MSRATLLILAFAVAGASGGLLLGRWLALPPEQPPPAGVVVAEPGDPLPATMLTGLDGAVRPLTHWQGRPLLLNFWATWCAPCVAEMPVLDAFRDTQGAQGVEVLGLALDEPGAVRRFLAERVQVGYPIVLAGPPSRGDLSVRLGNRRSVLPFSVLVGADGRIRATHIGDFSADELAAWVEENL